MEKTSRNFSTSSYYSGHFSLLGSDVLVNRPSDLSEPSGEPFLGNCARNFLQAGIDILGMASKGLGIARQGGDDTAAVDHLEDVHRSVGLLISPLLDSLINVVFLFKSVGVDFIDKCSNRY